MRTELTPATWIDHAAAWLNPSEASDMFETLRTELTWEHREVVIFGKPVLQPRLIAWAGAKPYSYSARTLAPRSITPTTLTILERVQALPYAPKDPSLSPHVLVNQYRDGKDSIGFHADDESELGSDPIVISVSLGATRKLRLKTPKGPLSDARTFPLGHSDLFTMGGACQREFHHGITKDARADGVRISLTFRWIVA